MSRHPESTYLLHMRDYAAEAVEFAGGRSREDLDTDRLFMLATCRLLQMLGEAASRLPAEYRDATPEVPWPQMIGLRHRLVHAYDVINLDMIWAIVKHDLPPLIATLEIINAKGGTPAPGGP